MHLVGLPSSRIDVVYNGGDFQPNDPAIPEQTPDFPVPADFFLFVGSLEPGKNLALLRETYQLAARGGKASPALAHRRCALGWGWHGGRGTCWLAVPRPSTGRGAGLPLSAGAGVGLPEQV